MICSRSNDSAVKHLAMRKTGFYVAKVVKTFGRLGDAAETLDEFRCKKLTGLPKRGEWEKVALVALRVTRISNQTA